MQSYNKHKRARAQHTTGKTMQGHAVNKGQRYLPIEAGLVHLDPQRFHASILFISPLKGVLQALGGQ